MKLFATSVSLTYPNGEKTTVSDLVKASEEIDSRILGEYVRAAWKSIGVEVAAAAITEIRAAR